ncbi:MAG: acetyl esterase [Acidimicrobiaceae bacterium]|jgi:acetyl esterase|nr:acetyl esterase [Acidimicrobiaceae bacterium]
MPLDPQAQTLLDQLAAMGMPGLGEMGVEETRQMTEQMGTMGGPGPELASVEDRTVAGPNGDVPVRVYRPAGDGPLPVLVWYHGGGWVIGSVAGSDSTCRLLADKSGVIVVSVEYGLAPEHPYPGPLQDCFAATQWVSEHAAELGGDPNRLAVGGDSAGGNLAAAVSLIAADRGGPPIAFQLLVYPATDLLMTYPSVKENGEGYLLTEKSMQWFTGHYLSGEENNAKDKLVSPIYSDEDELAALPPALVITAEYDPLRDEGEAYGKRLQQAGVPVTIARYEGQIHGFFGLHGVLDGATQALDQAADALKGALR